MPTSTRPNDLAPTHSAILKLKYKQTSYGSQAYRKFNILAKNHDDNVDSPPLKPHSAPSCHFSYICRRFFPAEGNHISLTGRDIFPLLTGRRATSGEIRLRRKDPPTHLTMGTPRRILRHLHILGPRRRTLSSFCRSLQLPLLRTSDAPARHF